MHIPKPQKIQAKFITGMVLASLFLGVAFSLGFYLHMRNVLEEEVVDKAKLILTHVDSVQHYVRDVLRPTMYERLPTAFVIQAMSSSYISRKIMASVNSPQDGTIFRRVAMDARNPDYEANDPGGVVAGGVTGAAAGGSPTAAMISSICLVSRPLFSSSAARRPSRLVATSGWASAACTHLGWTDIGLVRVWLPKVTSLPRMTRSAPFSIGSLQALQRARPEGSGSA